MAPKASTSKAQSSAQADAAAAAEEPLQAIVIGDAYGRGRHWGPLVYGNNEEEGYGEGSSNGPVSPLPWVSLLSVSRKNQHPDWERSACCLCSTSRSLHGRSKPWRALAYARRPFLSVMASKSFAPGLRALSLVAM
jgi:hypothetical protein